MIEPLICTAGTGDSATYRSGEYEFRLSADLGFGWQRCVILWRGQPIKTVTALNALDRATYWVRKREQELVSLDAVDLGREPVPELDFAQFADMQR